MSERIEKFLQQHGWDKATRSPVSAGASTREFTRLTQADGRKALLMDAGAYRPLPPHPYEQTIMSDLQPFAQVQSVLKSLDMSVPEIYGQSANHDMLLVEDFGEFELERLLKNGADPKPLLELAIDTLLELQQRFTRQEPDMSGLRHYNADFFLSHLAVIPEVYMPMLCGSAPNAAARQQFDLLWHKVLTRACATPNSLMLRDFSVSNTFYLKERQGINALGLIDFETAGTGPIIYDLVALLRANRYKVPADVTEACIIRFLKGMPQLNYDEFDAAYNILGTLRQVQWAGSCTLYTQQGRSGFLPKIEGIWQIIEGTLSHPAMLDVKGWFDENIPASARRAQEVAA